MLLMQKPEIENRFRGPWTLKALMSLNGARRKVGGRGSSSLYTCIRSHPGVMFAWGGNPVFGRRGKKGYIYGLKSCDESR